jgi:hypothetical protein
VGGFSLPSAASQAPPGAQEASLQPSSSSGGGGGGGGGGQGAAGPAARGARGRLQPSGAPLARRSASWPALAAGGADERAHGAFAEVRREMLRPRSRGLQCCLLNTLYKCIYAHTN